METVKKNFFVMKIHRVKEGVKIYAKSERLEEFFSVLHNDLADKDLFAKSVEYPNLEGYRSNMYKSLENTCGAIFDDWGNHFLTENGYPQLSFLRAVGLKDGITVELRGVFSLTLIDEFMRRTKGAIERLYSQYIKPVEVEIIIKGGDK